MSLDAMDDVHADVGPTVEDTERVGLTAAGVEAAARGTGPGDAPVFVVHGDPGNAFVTLRACGNEAWRALGELREGDRVEVRRLPVVDTGAAKPITEAGRRAGWGGEGGFFALDEYEGGVP